MSLLGDMQRKIRTDEFEFSKHTVDQSIIRRITVHEVREAILRDSELIKDYPDDKYGPGCLILGFTEGNRPLHIQCRHPLRPIIKIVTLYQPNPENWIDMKKWKKK